MRQLTLTNDQFDVLFDILRDTVDVIEGDLITTEVCTQHLTFDQDDVERLGERVLMNPPIRYSEDKETLWKRLRDGTIDCVVTDHALSLIHI